MQASLREFAKLSPEIVQTLGGHCVIGRLGTQTHTGACQKHGEEVKVLVPFPWLVQESCLLQKFYASSARRSFS